jgi:hypothetical protein
MSDASSILLPPGRVLQGDLYKAQTTDQQGNPLTIKNGPNAGKPTQQFYISIGIPKTGEQHWGSTAWGKIIWDQGHRDFPALIDRAAGYITRKFSWKVGDGDSTEANEAGRVNAQTEGMPGHWIVSVRSTFPFKITDAAGNPLPQEGLVKRGFWVEAFVSVAGNDNAQRPGVYINPIGIAYRAPDKEIVSGPDLRQAGFGRAALPPGVTAAPPSSGGPPPGVPSAGGAPVPGIPAPAPVPMGIPAAPAAAPYPAAGTAMSPPISAVPAPVGIVPAPAIRAPIAAAPLAPLAAPPPPPAPAPLPTGPVMTAAAGGASWEQFKAQGWTEAAARQAGYIV